MHPLHQYRGFTVTRTLPLLLLAALFSCDDGGGSTSDGSSSRHDVRRSEAGIPLFDSIVPGKAHVGDPCRQDSDCVEPPDAKCFTTLGEGSGPSITFPGGYCSRAYEETDGGSPDCGAGGGSFSLTGFGGQSSSTLMMCAKICNTEADCRVSEGYTCRYIFPGLPGFCLPK